MQPCVAFLPGFPLLCGEEGFLGKGIDQGKIKGFLKMNHLRIICFALKAVGGRLLPSYAKGIQ